VNDETMQRAFLAIAAHNNDTNILYRRSPEVLENFKTLSCEALKNYGPASYGALIDYCTKENISPGGSADLLQ